MDNEYQETLEISKCYADMQSAISRLAEATAAILSPIIIAIRSSFDGYFRHLAYLRLRRILVGDRVAHWLAKHLPMWIVMELAERGRDESES